MAKKTRLGILTGGGDCPGLNALIRAVVRRGILDLGYEFVGIEDGYVGLCEPDRAAPLTLENTRGVLPKGGTILGTSNKANPFQYAVKEAGRYVERDMSADAVRRYHELGLDGLIAVGGDGTLSIAHRLAKLHTTAEAHDRVMVLEVMGRHSGFLALESGIAGGADVILIPEIPYRFEPIVEKIKRRWGRHRTFSIIVVSEGAYPRGGAEAIVATADEIPGRGVVRLGGAGKVAADMIADHIEAEIRVTVLGHLQRGGGPTPADRILATRFGYHVLDLVQQDLWDHMVGLRRNEIIPVPLAGTSKQRRVDTNEI